MAITNRHVRFAWGLVDIEVQEAQTPSYAPGTDYASLGQSAAPGSGIGVRRATLRFGRSIADIPDDDVLMHFDFLNITGGDPDDTWITSDYTTLEGLITTWWGTTKAKAPNWLRLDRILWHRVGPGIPQPNYASRITDITTPAAGAVASVMPPQVASTLSLRTGLRRHWGRTYFPIGASSGSGGRVASADITALVGATVTMLQGALSADFQPVVISSSLNSALGVEAVAMDDLYDIQRRRRWKHRNLRTVTNL